MVKGLFFFLFLFFSIPTTFVNAQKTKPHVLSKSEIKKLKKEGSIKFAASDYKNALNAYLVLYKTDPQNIDYIYRIGFCYLETSIDKRAAMKYLEIANQSKVAKKEWIYFLGLAYMYNEKWDEAIKAFNTYKETSRSKLIKDFLNPVRMIEMCINAKELTSDPVHCTFTNLGKNINSPFEEYNPFISADEKSIVFTSRRKGNIGGYIEELGLYTSDIYRSLWKDTAWSKSKNMGAGINSEWDEESVGYTSLGDMVFIYFETLDIFGDLGTSSLKGKMWQKFELLFPQINSNVYEGGACMSNDGSTIFFSSTRKEGKGGTDLWMINKGKNGVWGNAKNLGSTINTIYDEDIPFLSLNGKRLYFSSKGWNSMGGFDIFYSDWSDSLNSWLKPVNIGFPINDADDNKFISLTGDERFAFVSAVRPNGYGERDIYKVEFLDTLNHSFCNLITGSITGLGGKIEITKITLENKKSLELSEYRPVTSTFQFIFAVKPGVYTLRAEGYNFLPYTEEIVVRKEYPLVVIKKNIKVKSSK